jgi:integrase
MVRERRVRPRTGGVRLRGKVFYVGMRLRPREGKQGPWYERKVDPPSDGGPYDSAYAALERAKMVRDYTSGRWDPERAEPTPAPPTRPVTVLEHVRAWAKGLTYESAGDDRRRVELYLAPAPIAPIALAALKPRDCAAWIAWLKERPSERTGTLSPSSVRNAYDVLQRALDQAVFDELLAGNPARIARKKLPAKRDKTPGARAGWTFTREEIEALISDPAVKPDRRVRYAILFLTGMRFGEFGALRWRDYDRAMTPLGRLTVARAIKSRSRREEETKTGAVKLVPVHPTLAAILAEWHLGGWPRAFGRAPTADDYVLPSVRGRKKGRPMNESAANRAFKADQLALKMARARHQHVARHAFISRAQDDGAEGSVLKWVTHAPPTSAFDGYTRAQWTRLCTEVAKLRIERRAGSSVAELGTAKSARKSATEGR